MAFDNNTLQQELDVANPNTVPDALRYTQLGSLLTPLKVTVTGLGAATSVDLTAAATLAAAILNAGSANYGVVGAAPSQLPPALVISTLRVTGSGGGNKPGIYVVTDVGGTPYDAGATTVGVATLSDDGKTIVFNATVTAFVIEYVPRSNTAMTAAYEQSPSQ